MEANNVIQFPKINHRLQAEQAVHTEETVQQTINGLKAHLVQEVTSMVCHPLFASLDASGFTLDERTMKEGAFVTEAIKAFIMKHHGVEHSFHKIARSMFEVDKHNNVNIVGNLKLKE